MTFAVIETGSKQYKVKEGDVITIEKLGDNMNIGDTVTFDKVLLIDDGSKISLGTPYLEKKTISGTLEKEGMGRKVMVIRYKAKSRYFKKRGHRQPYMKVKIGKIA